MVAVDFNADVLHNHAIIIRNCSINMCLHRHLYYISACSTEAIIKPIQVTEKNTPHPPIMPTHRSHPKHELHLIDEKTVYKCNGCKMDGYGERYRCNKCNFNLHKECINPSQAPTLTTLFPDSTFELMDRPPRARCKCRRGGYCDGVRVCDVCGITVNGFVYHCKKKGLDVHPLCAMLETEIRVEDVEFKLIDGAHSRCNWCKDRKLKGTQRKVPGRFYVSECGDYSFHVNCLMNMQIELGSTSSIANHLDKCEYKKLDDKRELVIPELRLKRKINPIWGRGSKFVKVIKLFLKIVMSVLIGDPTAIFASVVVELLAP